MSLRIPIRSKLALALAVPLTAVLVITAAQVREVRGDTREVREETELAQSVMGPGSLIRHLQDEQIDAIASVTGLRAAAPVDTEDMAASRALVDDARAELRAQLTSGELAGGSIYLPVLDELDQQLAAVRAEFDAVAEPYGLDRIDEGRNLTRGYEPMTAALEDANARLLARIDRGELREPVSVLNLIVRSKGDYLALVQWAVYGQISGDLEDPVVRAELLRARAMLESSRRDLALHVGPSEMGRITETSLESEDLARLRRVIDGQLIGEPLDPVATVELSARAERGTGDESRSQTEAYLSRTADRLVDDAVATERRFLAAAALIAVGALLAALLAARSITRPLRSLTRQAADMAGNRLPQAVQGVLETPLGRNIVMPEVPAVEVRTRDEVQDVAAALNRVQQSALDLAVEQAVMRHHIADSFVNLGRRTQNLINRQLEMITDLERDETDPEALARLFDLDHLATRARRNAESLVVLAGEETPRSFAAPIAMREVLLASRGEVEGYERVKVVVIDDIGVPGGAAADLVHLLAELVENGLAFSPPERSVEVVGRLTPRGYVIGVVDQGLGMSEAELARANARLAGAEDFTVAPSRYLGHYVVGHLAARLGAEVSLQDAFTGGTAARVVIPLDRLADAVGATPGVLDLTDGAPAVAGTTGSAGAPLELPERATSGEHDDDELIGVGAGGGHDGDPPSSADGPISVAFDDGEMASVVVEGRPPRRVDPPERPLVPSGAPADLPQDADAGPAGAADRVPGSTTPNGLARRVPGAQRKRSSTLSRGPVWAAEEPATAEARAQERAALLTSFAAGFERGRVDVQVVTNPLDVALASANRRRSRRQGPRPFWPDEHHASSGGADGLFDEGGRSGS